VASSHSRRSPLRKENSMTDPQFHYYPWVRIGNARLIKEVDDPQNANQPARAQITVTGKITTDDQNRSASLALNLFGPGEITGLDERQVIRTDPPNHATDFEPHLFPLIDFYWPSLPWLFTPTAPDATGHLRPWLCLVVVKQEGSRLSYDPGRPLPVLTVDSPGAELSDPNESWAWAYAQITGTVPAGGTGKLLAAKSEQTLSRLVCPRRLEGGVAYRACVVPVFSAGRKTGLGQPLTSDDEKLGPAWNSDTPGPLELPVYYHWEFSTGPAGDFEALVWELRPKPVPENSGYRPIAVEKPADDWSEKEQEQTTLGSALRPPDTTPPADSISESFREELRKILNAHEDWEGKVDLPPGMPLPPPFYARWHAAQQSLPKDESTAGQPGNARWLRQLNLEIAYRAVAGLGVRVVQEQQEALVASAWEQLGEVERANQALRQAQLAMETGRRIYEQHLEPLAKRDPMAFLALTGPVHSRITRDGRTMHARIVESCLPLASMQGAFRRLTRPRGPLGRRLGGTEDLTSRLARKLNLQDSPVRPRPRIPSGTVTGASLDLQLICELSPETLMSLDLPGEGEQFSTLRRIFLEIAVHVQESLMAFCDNPPPSCSRLPVQTVSTAVLNGLKPWETVPARIGDRLKLPKDRLLDPMLDPILAHPVFPQPMYRSLVELSEDFLLSGVEDIPPDTILLLESNALFIEAFMAGLNDEMGRELLWRGYPTDQRGSYFRRFWDTRSNLSAPEAVVWDITPIHEWQADEGLGDHRPGETEGAQAVLLVRGRLLQRFPDALIFAAKAKWAEDGSGKRIPVRPDADSAAEKYPIFQGVLPPDLTFLGFVLSADEMRGDQKPEQNKPGWFIILQQRPTKPRYGLDETRPTTYKGTWEDLSWEDIDLTPSGHVSPSIPLKADFKQPTQTPDKDMAWGVGLTSAQLAYMTLQTPVRVAIHASDLLPAKAS
jgi:hypothetical protein